MSDTLSLQMAADKFREAGKFLGKIFTFSLADEHLAPGRCLSAHLDSGGISVAYGIRFLSNIKIKGTRHYPFEAGRYPGPEAFASTVHLALAGFHAMNAAITFIIPKEWTIVTTADFPAIVKKNLAHVVGYELDRLTPLSPEKAYYDYRIIREEDSRLQIVVAAVKSATLDPYLQALKQRGIEAKRIIVSLSALTALSSHVQGGGAAAFLEIRPQGYEGGLMDKRGLTASFAGSFPGDTEPEKTRIMSEELNPLIDAWKKEGKRPAVFINARAGALPLLAESIHAPVRYFSATDLKLHFPSRDPVIPAVAIGGVLESLRPGLAGLNLLAKSNHQASRAPLALTILLICTLAGLGIFYLTASLQTEERKVAAVEREIAMRRQEVRRVETLKKEAAEIEKEIGAIAQFKTARPMVLNLLKELTLTLPPTSWLTKVRISDAAINIEGQAASPTDILSKLETSRYFKKVEFSSPTFRDVRTNSYRFAIKMEMEGLPEEKGKDGKK